MKIAFYKMHGAANDFVVVDHRQAAANGGPAAHAARLCDRRRGIGADGLLLLERDPELDFAMAYWNADGSPAEFCGNGARCLARLALDLGLGRAGRVRFRTPYGPMEGARSAEGIRVALGLVQPAGPEEMVEAAGRRFGGRLVRSGVPHFVTGVESAAAVPVPAWGAALRGHVRFAPEGANVDFAERLGRSHLRMRTYERGVEGETLACGSGAVACALAAAAEGEESPVRVLTQGGDELIVDWVREEGGFRAGLSGPAEISFVGTWEEDPHV